MIATEQFAELLARARVASGAPTAEVVAPFTGESFVQLPASTNDDVAAATATLRGARAAWQQVPVKERAAIVLRFHDLLLDERRAGLDLAQLETGKTRLDAQLELLDIALTARHYARSAARLLRPRRHLGAFPLAVGVLEVRQAKGLVGIISPWNYPLTLAISDAIPALLAGNTVLLKPDPQTSLSALWLVDLMRRAGLPDDVLQVVLGGGEVGSLVVEVADYVQFTGSTAVGRVVAKRCGERLVGCSLELGGKNAMIIRGDADPRKAATIAQRACFSNAGQLCIAMERIYVQADAYDGFVAAFVDAVRAMRIATAVGWGGDMGVLTSARQLAKVQEHVDDAKALGATVLVGGRARPDLAPFAFEPTVVTGVTGDMAICDEETFGPVVAITRVADDDEAVRRANDTSYGLNASIVSSDVPAAQRLARRIRAGSVNINEGFGASWGSVRAPMGGMGDSGLGRRHGDEGLLKFTESQTIATQRFLGFGTPAGWSDERFGDALTAGFALMKRIGLR